MKYLIILLILIPLGADELTPKADKVLDAHAEALAELKAEFVKEQTALHTKAIDALQKELNYAMKRKGDLDLAIKIKAKITEIEAAKTALQPKTDFLGNPLQEEEPKKEEAPPKKDLSKLPLKELIGDGESWSLEGKVRKFLMVGDMTNFIRYRDGRGWKQIPVTYVGNDSMVVGWPTGQVMYTLRRDLITETRLNFIAPNTGKNVGMDKWRTLTTK